jgi:ATP-dependent protease ClpP protease subunit
MKKINIKGQIMSNDMAWLYKWFGMSAACPDDITKGLEEAAGDDVIIEINSPGGICVYGYEMYKAVKEYGGRVTAHVISAMSAATLVACAADETLMSDAAIFMIHNTQSTAQGDYRDMHMEGQALEEFNSGIINVYMRKTGMDRGQIQELMDNDTYMSPAKAIELGFADGYIFGNPAEKQENVQNLMTGIVASGTGIMSEDKAMELIRLIKTAGAAGDINPQPTGDNTVADIQKNKGGNIKMTLDEFLAENPEARGEVEEIRAAAEKSGRDSERERIKSLDAIAATVKAEALNEAKYGEKPLDGPTLAYRAMVDGDKLAGAYMQNALRDSGASGVDNVGIGTPDAGQEPDNEADEMAAHINNLKGGK